MRCVERCLEGFPNELTAIWSIARGLTRAWVCDRKEPKNVKLDSYKLTTAEQALEEIGDLVESFAQKRFGTDDLVKISGAEGFLLGPEGMDLSRRYKPFPE